MSNMKARLAAAAAKRQPASPTSPKPEPEPIDAGAPWVAGPPAPPAAGPLPADVPGRTYGSEESPQRVGYMLLIGCTSSQYGAHVYLSAVVGGDVVRANEKLRVAAGDRRSVHVVCPLPLSAHERAFVDALRGGADVVIEAVR